MPAQAWVTLVVGVLALVGVLVTWRQKNSADRRAEWWRRATWAVDHTLSDNIDAQLVGFDVLGKLQGSPLITRSDRDLFASWATARVFPPEDGIDVDDLVGDTDGDQDERKEDR